MGKDICCVTGCDQTVLLFDGWCYKCGWRLCVDHVEDGSVHPCADSSYERKDDVEEQHACESVDIPLIITKADALRPGHTSSIPPLILTGSESNVIAHGTNAHLPLTFDDGEEWLVRLRHNSPGSPIGPLIADIVSEAATFRAIWEKGVRVPRVWLPGSPQKTFSRETLYFFVERIQGHYHRALAMWRPDPATEFTIKVLRNFAKWMIAFETVHFDAVGSLTFDEYENVVVGPMLEPNYHKSYAQYPLGPFANAKERYLAHFERTLTAVLENRWCAPSRRLRTYLVNLEARELVSVCEELETGPWYIQHGEPRGDHILIDGEGNITGVIDWERSYLTCKSEAFAAPWGFVHKDYDKGSNALGTHEEVMVAVYEELGRHDLADFVRKGKKFQRLAEASYGDISWRQAAAMRQAFLREPGETDLTGQTEEEWEKEVMERHKDDEGLVMLLKLENQRNSIV